MKYAAAMTLYNPEIDIIYNLIRTSKLFDVLYVYDNSGQNSSYVEMINNCANIIYIWKKTNNGLPIAFNVMVDLAYHDEIDFLCTLDQDSILTKENVAEIKQYIETELDLETVAVAPYPTGTKGNKKKRIEEVKWVICSGCFINLKLLKRNNIKYDECYFVDRFDADICMQMRICGLKIIRLNNIVLQHRCGDEDGSHSILRHYYMFRNRFYYNYKYYAYPIAFIRTGIQNIRHMIYLVKNLKNIKECVKIYSLGKSDYKKGRMGKITPGVLEKIKNSYV